MIIGALSVLFTIIGPGPNPIKHLKYINEKIKIKYVFRGLWFPNFGIYKQPEEVS